MTAPLSPDLRYRLVRAVEGGASARQAAARFEVSPSAAIKLMQRVRKTGSTAPARIGVIINDSPGRAWRVGSVGIAIGVAGVASVLDLRGRLDRDGREMQASELGVADEIAAAASIVMGQAAEGIPAAIIRGADRFLGEGRARDLVRDSSMDLFR